MEPIIALVRLTIGAQRFMLELSPGFQGWWCAIHLKKVFVEFVIESFACSEPMITRGSATAQGRHPPTQWHFFDGHLVGVNRFIAGIESLATTIVLL